jgi:predicted RNase H-like HicB family nuclease
MKGEHHKVTLVESEEGFAVWCDNLPGCCSQGATRQEAMDNIREAIREYLAARLDLEAHFGARIQHAEVTV